MWFKVFSDVQQVMRDQDLFVYIRAGIDVNGGDVDVFCYLFCEFCWDFFEYNSEVVQFL